MSPPRASSTANTAGGLDSKGWGEPARRTTARKCHVFPAGAERRRRLTAHEARGSTSRHHPAALPRIGVVPAAGCIVAIHLACVPAVFRYSRLIWAHLNVGTLRPS